MAKIKFILIKNKNISLIYIELQQNKRYRYYIEDYCSRNNFFIVRNYNIEYFKKEK